MKIILLSISLIVSGFMTIAQNTGACNDFSNATGLSEYDPNNKVSYSVANNELTIVFTAAAFWGQNEMKWDFPSPINISGLSSPTINYDVAVTSVVVSGTGTGCGAINYTLFGVSFYDGNNNTYSNGTASNGYYQSTFVAGSNPLDAGSASLSNIVGISIKPASFSDAACDVSSSGTITATVKIKNLKIGNAICGGSNGVNVFEEKISEAKIYPNPSSEKSTLSLKLNDLANIKITLHDLTGKEIIALIDGRFTEVKREINTADLSAGTYIVNYTIDGARKKSELLVVVK